MGWCCSFEVLRTNGGFTRNETVAVFVSTSALQWVLSFAIPRWQCGPLLNKNNASHEVLPAQPTLSTFWTRSIKINCFNHVIIINDKPTELPRSYVQIEYCTYTIIRAEIYKKTLKKCF